MANSGASSVDDACALARRPRNTCAPRRARARGPSRLIAAGGLATQWCPRGLSRSTPCWAHPLGRMVTNPWTPLCSRRAETPNPNATTRHRYLRRGLLEWPCTRVGGPEAPSAPATPSRRRRGATWGGGVCSHRPPPRRGQHQRPAAASPRKRALATAAVATVRSGANGGDCGAESPQPLGRRATISAPTRSRATLKLRRLSTGSTAAATALAQDFHNSGPPDIVAKPKFGLGRPCSRPCTSRRRPRHLARPALGWPGLSSGAFVGPRCRTAQFPAQRTMLASRQGGYNEAAEQHSLDLDKRQKSEISDAWPMCIRLRSLGVFRDIHLGPLKSTPSPRHWGDTELGERERVERRVYASAAVSREGQWKRGPTRVRPVGSRQTRRCAHRRAGGSLTGLHWGAMFASSLSHLHGQPG